jgi:endonuclease/exonuclease/phosphatase family metal-dependent hydrolase/lysophospholipase L1-like esterase
MIDYLMAHVSRLALLLALSASSLADQPTRVMSFNIRFATADDGADRWENRRELLIQTIRAFNPDILGAQEVLASQARELRAALPDHEFVGVGRDDGVEAGEFTPILFRRSVLVRRDAGHFWLSRTPDKPGSMGWDAACTRIATWARLAPADAALCEFVVINTHLDHRGERARLESARQLRRFIDSLGDVPIILMGDFNCGPGESPYAELCDPAKTRNPLRDSLATLHPADTKVGTFHGFRGRDDGRRIDWILASPAIEPLAATIDRTQRDGRYPSDHFAVTATLRLPGRPAFAASTRPTATRPGDEGPARWAKAIREFTDWDAKNTPPSGAVLFVGSSSIRNWPTAQSFPRWAVINRGFGGSHLSDVNHFFDQVVRPYDARAIVLYVGDNDIAAGKSPERVRDDFREFVGRVRAMRARVPIAFLSIKPSRARWEHWPAMRRANELIDEECRRGEHLHYIDVASSLLDENGVPRESLFVDDKLHLSEVGYAAWTEKLKSVLEPVMK